MIALVGFLFVQTTWAVSPNDPALGDTVVIERLVVTEVAGVQLRAHPLEPTAAIEPLRDPELSYETSGIRVRYAVAPFTTGETRAAMPEMELIYPDGRLESIEAVEVVFNVTSVLPGLDTLPPPKPSQAPIGRGSMHYEPALLLSAGMLLLALAWGVQRRRTKPRPAWQPEDGESGELPLTRWVSSGEPRAVAAVITLRFREMLAQQVPKAHPSLSMDQCLEVIHNERPDWPHDQLRDLGHALDRASYAPAVPSDVLMLADDIQELAPLFREPVPKE